MFVGDVPMKPGFNRPNPGGAGEGIPNTSRSSATINTARSALGTARTVTFSGDISSDSESDEPSHIRYVMCNFINQNFHIFHVIKYVRCMTSFSLFSSH